MGALFNLVGYAGLWLVAGVRPPGAPPVPLWQPFLLLMLAANGGGWLDMGSLMTLLHNAGAERAMTTGVAKSLLGLGAAVFACVYTALLRPNARAFILLCALAPSGVTALAVPLVVRLPRDDAPGLARPSPARAARLWALGCWVVSLCFFLFGANVVLHGAPSRRTSVAVTVALLLLLLLPPALLLLLAGVKSGLVGGDAAAGDAAKEPLLLGDGADDDLPEAPTLPPGPPAEPGTSPRLRGPSAEPGPPPRLRGQRCSELTLGGSLRTPEFWLLFFALSCGGGAAVTMINNLGQLVHALGAGHGPETYVALLSVANAAGRLVQGAASDAAAQRGLPRPLFLVLALGTMSAALLGLATASPVSLAVCVAVVGLCFGSLWSFTPVVVAELFGERCAGSVYGFVGISPAVGGLFLNTAVAGRVYDSHTVYPPPAPPGAPPGPPARCVGHACFALTFRLGALACAAGAFAGYTLLRRTRHFYATPARR